MWDARICRDVLSDYRLMISDISSRFATARWKSSGMVRTIPHVDLQTHRLIRQLRNIVLLAQMAE